MGRSLRFGLFSVCCDSMRCAIVTWRQHATSCVTPGLLESHMTGWSRTGVLLRGGVRSSRGCSNKSTNMQCLYVLQRSCSLGSALFWGAVWESQSAEHRWLTSLKVTPSSLFLHLITHLLFTLTDVKPGLLKSLFLSPPVLFLLFSQVVVSSPFSYVLHVLFFPSLSCSSLSPPFPNMSAISLKALLNWFSCFTLSLKMSTRGSGKEQLENGDVQKLILIVIHFGFLFAWAAPPNSSILICQFILLSFNRHWKRNSVKWWTASLLCSTVQGKKKKTLHTCTHTHTPILTPTPAGFQHGTGCTLRQPQLWQ